MPATYLDAPADTRRIHSIPLAPDTERIATQIALAMYGSDRTVESLPVMRTWSPWEPVTLVPMALAIGGDL